MNEQKGKAGHEAILDKTLDAVTDIFGAISKLDKDGHSVNGFKFGDNCVPTVSIRPSRLCERLIESGEAAYYYRSHCERKGQFRVNGVRVVWSEPLH